MRHAVLPRALLALMLVACAGGAARQRALLPAMHLAWPGVRADVVASAPGPEVLAIADDMDSALASDDPQLVVLVPWPPLRDAATAGILAKEQADLLGPSPAASLRERVARFGEAYDHLVPR